MKIKKYLSILLSLCLLVQCIPLAALADDPTTASIETTETTAATVPPASIPAEIPFGSVCVQRGCRTIEGMTPLASIGAVSLPSAQSAFLYEINTGTVVYSMSPDLNVAPGSLAKIVNAIVAIEHLPDLDEVVTMTREINRRPSGSQQAGLKVEEEVTVRDLLYCLILQAANDAAIALAVHVAGSQMAYVNLMNEWVKSAGCTATEFGNVHGLDTAESRTTARDMAKIVIAANQNETFREVFEALDYKMNATNKSENRSFRSLNYMQDKGTIQDFYYDTVKGGFPSYVPAYGASLVITADSKGMNYVGVVMNCTRTFHENGWMPLIYGNFNEMSNLIKMGYAKYKVNRILYKGMALNGFTVADGESNAIGQVNVDIDSVVPIDAQMNNLYMNFSVTGGGLTAPIEKGQQIATMQIQYLDSVLAEAEVYAMGNVQSATNNGIRIEGLKTEKESGGGGFLTVLGTICVILVGLAVVYLTLNAYLRNRRRAMIKKRRANRRRLSQ